MSKKLNAEAILNELSEGSAFFKEPVPSPAVTPEVQTASTPVKEDSNEDVRTDVRHDVTHDVVTSMLQGVDLRSWRDAIENTETQNSALRLTSEERYTIEDVVSELKRKFGIKTSMNEIARLGLLLLVHDYKQSKKDSLVHKVKRA